MKSILTALIVTAFAFVASVQAGEDCAKTCDKSAKTTQVGTCPASKLAAEKSACASKTLAAKRVQSPKAAQLAKR